ncbi:MAG: electron transport complex subunit RsxC [Bacteroidota bacterium]
MSRIKTFKRGGIHLTEMKYARKMPVEGMPLAEVLYFPLFAISGKPPLPIVQAGDKVKAGQLIAKADGLVSTNMHTSVSGEVAGIEIMTDNLRGTCPTIVIKREDDNWLETIDRSDDLLKEIKSSPQQIIERIRDCGINGMGGASFPTHVKLMVPDDCKVETLIINGAECEPYLTSDHRLMLERGPEILVGTKILMKALGVSRAIIGIEVNKKDALKNLAELAAEYEGISVQPLKTRYPQGGEKQLIQALVRREVPAGKLPAHVGVVVHNTGTAFAVYEAVQKNKPLFERYVTVAGKKVAAHKNLLVRCGTLVSEIIRYAGGLPEDTAKILVGGPMMGRALGKTEIPIGKETNGIVLLTEKEAKQIRTINCMRCGHCVQVCPVNLRPYMLEAMVRNELIEMAGKHHIVDCMECGCCQYACGSGRQLLEALREGKKQVMQLNRKKS